MNTRLLVMLLVSVSVFQGEARGDTFALTSGDPLLEVEIPYTQGNMSGTSSVDVQSGGSVDQLFAYGRCNILISNGHVGSLFAGVQTEVYMSSGSVDSLFAGDDSRVAISGGAVTDYLGGWGDCMIEITGGAIAYLDAIGSSHTTFYGYGWSATGGLSIVDDEVSGTGILSGYWPDGTDWSTEIWKDDNATVKLVTDSSPCGECKGKVNQLTLRYTGTPAEVRIEQKGKKGERDRKAERGEKGKKGEKRGRGKKRERHEKGQRREKGRGISDGVVVFEGELEEGELFTFVGLDNKGTLGTEISLFIDDELDTKIHTSCSRPIYPGMTSGLFEVVEGYSLEGGLICPLDTEPPHHGCK